MKKYFLILFLVLASNSYSQAYYPNLDNLFLTNEDDESLFSDNLLYFKSFLKESTKRMFYADLQANVSRDNTSSFYSLSLVPRGNKSFLFLNTGINLIFDPSTKEKYPKIYITNSDFIKKENNIESVKGDLAILNEGMILEFPQTMIIPLDSNKKSNVDKEKRSRFMITKIDYELSKSKFVATIKGNFDSLIKLTKTTTVPKTIHSISIELTKDLITIQIYFIEKMNKVQSFTLLEKKVDLAQ